MWIVWQRSDFSFSVQTLSAAKQRGQRDLTNPSQICVRVQVPTADEEAGIETVKPAGGEAMSVYFGKWSFSRDTKADGPALFI